MPEVGDQHQIILLPEENYWDWVGVVRDYAVRYRASVTPTPEKAVRFHRPNQVITLVDAPGAFADYAPIVDWLRQAAPEVALDVIRAGTPEELKSVLDERIRQGQRFGAQTVDGHRADALPLRLRWPTDHPVITQAFGATPEVYRRWGLPGHDGLDFRAPMNSRVYACADGEVYMVHDGTGGHPYGIHVRVRHAGGYKTVYAHLNRATVHTGQFVKTGDEIGLAGSTGNSARSHLHLVLKKDGATRAGLTDYPGDIIDPTPFLDERPEYHPAHWRPDWWPYERPLLGLHARIGGPMEEADWAVVREVGVEALKFDCTAASGDIDRARTINPDMFVLVQISTRFDLRPLSARAFVARVRENVRRYYEQGVRFFEVHDEPNLTVQGYGTSWRSGEEFGDWFLDVVGRLRAEFPEARFGWPGLSAAPTTSGIRVDHRAFLESAGGAVQQADWIGCHCHWHGADDLLSEEGGLLYRLYRDEWPGKLLLITEFSNPSPYVSAQAKGEQVAEFLNLIEQSGDVGAAFGFVVSAAQNYPYEQWRTEDGALTPIARAVAARRAQAERVSG